MTQDGKRPVHIRWDSIEFGEIEEVARLRNETEHTEFSALDIIRIATRQYCAEFLAAHVRTATAR